MTDTKFEQEKALDPEMLEKVVKLIEILVLKNIQEEREQNEGQ